MSRPRIQTIARIALLTLTVGALATAVAAAETPITAQTSSKWYVYQPDGSRILTKDERGIFARDSDGDQVLSTPTSTVMHRSGKVYKINRNTKTYSVQASSSPVVPDAVSKAQPTQKAQIINSLFCVPIPMHDGGPNGPVHGTAWLSVDYGFIVRQEVDVYTAGKPALHVVEDVTDVQVGTDPNPALFAMPSGYTRVPGSQCPQCMR